MKLTKTTFFLGCLVGGMGAAVVPLLITSTQADSKLLPFQGRLTDAAGTAVADGAKVVEFKIYDAPTGGNVKWAGEVHKLSINGGLVNTMLGSKAGLGNVDFSSPSFLQITVDANSDGQITAADPPLLPRQSVVGAVYASEAGNSRKLNGSDWSAILVDGIGTPTNNAGTGQISGTRIKDGTIGSEKLSVGSGFTDAFLADNSVKSGELADNSVDSSAIIDRQVKTEDLAGAVANGVETEPGAVTSEKIKDGTVQSADIARGGVNPDRLNRDIVVLADVKGTNQAGGTNGIGWMKRTLGTVEHSLLGAASSVSLTGDTITLQPGTYWIRALVPAFNTRRNQAALRDTTNTATPTVVLRGTSVWPGGGTDLAHASSWIEGPVTVANTARIFEIWQFTSEVQPNTGLGVGVDDGPLPRPEQNVFTRIVIERIR